MNWHIENNIPAQEKQISGMQTLQVAPNSIGLIQGHEQKEEKLVSDSQTWYTLGKEVYHLCIIVVAYPICYVL